VSSILDKNLMSAKFTPDSYLSTIDLDSPLSPGKINLSVTKFISSFKLSL
jgi:hypothetical protein